MNGVHAGHHVSAMRALDLGVVKAVSPLRGSSEGESLDDAEASAKISGVMADRPATRTGPGAETSRGCSCVE